LKFMAEALVSHGLSGLHEPSAMSSFVTSMPVLLLVLPVVSGSGPGRPLRGLQDAFLPPPGPTFTTTTVTTQTATLGPDPCPQATTACECAEAEICGWRAAAGGGGNCENMGTKGHIDCHLCGTQPHCLASNCPMFSTACSCAHTDGCRWDVTSSSCVAKISFGTPCEACPSQTGCAVEVPEAVSYNPANEGKHNGGTSLTIVIWFNDDMRWCSNSYAMGDEVKFWCDGSVLEHHVPRQYVSFATSTMMVDMDWVLQTFTLTTGRTCGLSIGQGKICDQDEVAFNGISRGSYSFLLTDQEAPVCIDFDAMEGYGYEVPLDGSVNMMWSEPVKLNSNPPQATLSQLEYVDGAGTTAVVNSVTFAVEAPDVEIVSASKLSIRMSGKIRSGLLYSLEMPGGAVLDVSGNPCLNVAYRFRAAVDSREWTETATNTPAGTSVGLVILIVLVVVTCMVVIGVTVVRLYKLNAARFTFNLTSDDGKRPQYKTVQSQPIPVGAGMKPEPTFANASAAAENAYRAAAAAADRIRQDQENEEGGTNAKPGTAYAWARPSQKADKGSATSSGNASGSGPRAAAQAKVYPGREAFNSGAKRRSGSEPSGSKEKPRSQSGDAGAKASGSAGASPPPKAPVPQEDSNVSPEVKAIEKQLRAMMDKPIADRKKAFKELLVEYHPDKNSATHAKEVFQYVNNARGWFLVDT